MVRLTIEVDDKTFQAAEAEAKQRGTAIETVVANAIRVPEESAPAPLPDGDKPQEWGEFFKWLDGLNLRGRYRFGSREDIYVR